MREARLHPKLPPAEHARLLLLPDVEAPRAPTDNWYSLPYEERLQLMHGHGAVGRTFRGRVLQLVTGSTGLDDWEWGVTLFGRDLDDAEGVRLHDALRRGIRPLRGVRPVRGRGGRKPAEVLAAVGGELSR